MELHIDDKYLPVLTGAFGGSLEILETLYSFEIPGLTDEYKMRLEAWFVAKSLKDYSEIIDRPTAASFSFTLPSLKKYLKNLEKRNDNPTPLIRRCDNKTILGAKKRLEFKFFLANYVITVQRIKARLKQEESVEIMKTLKDLNRLKERLNLLEHKLEMSKPIPDGPR